MKVELFVNSNEEAILKKASANAVLCPDTYREGRTLKQSSAVHTCLPAGWSRLWFRRT